jgi:hypothetical protein
VGVNPRTGKRWRLGRTVTSSSGAKLHYPPVITARKAEIPPRYLSEDERVRCRALSGRPTDGKRRRWPCYSYFGSNHGILWV